jgi:hypothetical protein
VGLSSSWAQHREVDFSNVSGLDGGTIRNFDFDGICSKSFVEDGAREADIGIGAGRIGSKDGGTGGSCGL